MQVNEYQKYDINAMSGYGAMLLYRIATAETGFEGALGKYALLLPLETVPSPFGSTDSFDFDLLTSPTKGKVQGKESLDDIDVEFLLTRDNILRLESFEGKVMDFLVMYQDYSARAFSGTIKVRPNEVTADVARGTFTITPMSALPTTLPDARDLIVDTITFVGQTPNVLNIPTEGEGIQVPIAVSEEGSVLEVSTSDTTNFMVKLGESGTAGATSTETLASGVSKTNLVISSTAVNKNSIITIEVKKNNFAGWKRTIAVKSV